MASARARCVLAVLALTAVGAEAPPRGEPLPADALHRLGPSRFRVGRQVCFLAFSKDGKTLLSVNEDSLAVAVRVWDAANGKQLREYLLPMGIAPAAANLSADGRLLAIRCFARADIVLLVDAATGREIRHVGTFGGFALAPDGRSLAVADEKGTILLRDPIADRSLGRWQGAEAPCKALAFSPDGKRAASADEKSVVRLWDPAAGRELRRCQAVEIRPQDEASLTFSPDGTMLLAGCPRALHLWDTQTGRLLRTVPLPDGKGPHSAPAFSPDGKQIACEHGGSVRLWDVSTGKEVRRLGLRLAADADHDSVALAFSPDGKVLATGDKQIHLWNMADGKELRFDDAPAVDAAAFTPDGRYLATGGPDALLRLWDTSTFTEARKVPLRPPDVARSWEGTRANAPLAFSPDGKRLLLTRGKQFFLCDAADGKERRRGEAPPKSRWYWAPSPDGRLLAWSARDTDGSVRVHLFDATTNRELHSWTTRVRSGPFLRFTPRGRLLLAYDLDTCEIFDVAAGTKRSLPGSGELLAVSADERLVARYFQGRLVFQELASGDEFARTEGYVSRVFPSLTHAAVFSPDGRTLAATIEYGGPVGLWETATGKERLRLGRARGTVTQLAFAPDGDRLVSVSTEQNAVVWRVFGPPAGQAAAGPDAERLRRLWSALAGEEGAVAFRAMRELTAAPRPTAEFLRQHLRPVPRVSDPRQVERWIADLDSADFTAREKATRELARLRLLAEGPLRRALEDRPSLEARRRIEELLERLKPLRNRPVSPEEVRAGRAVEVLEHLHIPEARKLLEALADGEPGDPLTRQARAALERRDRRP